MRIVRWPTGTVAGRAGGTGSGRPDSAASGTIINTHWFRGSEARARRPDGRGLGLAIAAESVTRLGLSLTFHRPGESGLRAEIRPGLD